MRRIIAFVMLGLSMPSMAQNKDDIFRYSNQSILGSARTLGLSGAWGAAGADLSAASYNPAGLGLYRRNEMMGAISITTTGNKSEYQGNTATESRTAFNIPNLGLAYTYNNLYMGKPATKGFVSGTLGFGMNRLNDFQSNMFYSGKINNSSIGDYLASLGNGTDSSFLMNEEMDNDLFAQAWRTWVINNKGAKDQYESILKNLGDTNYSVFQQHQIQNRGRMNEWYVSGGINLSNFLYLGASLVVQSAQFSSVNTYSESLVSSSLVANPYSSSQVTQTFRSSGAGVGGKFGIILRPFDFFRVGFSYHTPVRLNFTDYVTNSISSVYNSKSFEENGIEEYIKYQIFTPQRLNASASIVIGKLLLINGDFERIDYSQGRLGSKNNQYDFGYANDANKVVYGIAQNYKVGAEICAKYTRYRLGYALLGSPFNENYMSKSNGNKHLISAGFGWIYENQYFFDFAVSNRIGKDYVTPYEGNPISAVNQSQKLNFVFAMGKRF